MTLDDLKRVAKHLLNEDLIVTIVGKPKGGGRRAPGRSRRRRGKGELGSGGRRDDESGDTKCEELPWRLRSNVLAFLGGCWIRSGTGSTDVGVRDYLILSLDFSAS